jgi:hypothetical protein
MLKGVLSSTKQMNFQLTRLNTRTSFRWLVDTKYNVWPELLHPRYIIDGNLDCHVCPENFKLVGICPQIGFVRINENPCKSLVTMNPLIEYESSSLLVEKESFSSISKINSYWIPNFF